MKSARLRCTIGRTFSIIIALISDSTSIVVMCIFFELSSQHLLRIRKLCGGKARFNRHPSV